MRKPEPLRTAPRAQTIPCIANFDSLPLCCSSSCASTLCSILVAGTAALRARTQRAAATARAIRKPQANSSADVERSCIWKRFFPHARPILLPRIRKQLRLPAHSPTLPASVPIFNVGQQEEACGQPGALMCVRACVRACVRTYVRIGAHAVQLRARRPYSATEAAAMLPSLTLTHTLTHMHMHTHSSSEGTQEGTQEEVLPRLSGADPRCAPCWHSARSYSPCQYTRTAAAPPFLASLPVLTFSSAGFTLSAELCSHPPPSPPARARQTVSTLHVKARPPRWCMDGESTRTRTALSPVSLEFARAAQDTPGEVGAVVGPVIELLRGHRRSASHARTRGQRKRKAFCGARDSVYRLIPNSFDICPF